MTPQLHLLVLCFPSEGPSNPFTEREENLIHLEIWWPVQCLFPLGHGLGEPNLSGLSMALLTRFSQHNCLTSSRQHCHLHDKDKQVKEHIFQD